LCSYSTSRNERLKNHLISKHEGPDLI